MEKRIELQGDGINRVCFFEDKVLKAVVIIRDGRATTLARNHTDMDVEKVLKEAEKFYAEYSSV